MSEPLIGIGVSAFGRTPRIRLALRLAELGAGVAFVLVALPGGSDKYTTGLLAAIVSGLAWLAWILAGDRRGPALAALTVLSAAGGVCAAAHPTGLLFAFVAVAATAYSFTTRVAIAVLAPAVAGFLVTGLAGSFPDRPGTLASFGVMAIVLGFARRQLVERGRESDLLATAERRAVLADREAELTSERNRLGREIHDVLAHTLGTVSIQLTALDSRLGAGDPPEALRARVRALHELVGEGLDEARDAVRALRDEKLALESQIARLCDLHDAAFEVTGRSRPLRADEALALYRVVQEALTNADRHAPGAAASVSLTYKEGVVEVAIRNGPATGSPSPAPTQGGGNGLAGMRARVELLGGTAGAGPEPGGGWLVTATIPRR
jgi:signal transduction histidine kinase